MSDLNAVYTELKYWLPMVTLATLFWKARAAVTKWADTLLNNHLHSIQDATQSTEKETKNTNILLSQVQSSFHDHQEKQMQVWGSVVKTMAVLEDRTRRSRTPKKATAYAKRKQI